MLTFNILLLTICGLSSAIQSITPPFLVTELPKCEEDIGVHLNFTNSGLRRIPKSFLPSPTVTCVSLEDNSIEEIDKAAFEKLPNLQYLNLRHNQFLSKSEILSTKFPALKTLILDDSTFANSESCRYSYCRDFDITLDLVAPNLEKLFLRRNGLGSIAMNETSNLKELYLNNNKLTTFTVQGERPNLTHLHLGDNSIRSINLKHFPNLTELVLDRNRISQIGNNDCYYCESLRFENNFNLQRLSVKGNALTRISLDTLRSLVSLKYFDLSENALLYVPEDEFTLLKNIQTLLLNNNKLENTPNFSGLKNLEYLLLNNNQIRGIGKNVFRDLPKLALLKLNNNEVKEIVAGTFDEMPSLMELDLSNNKLTTCADGWIYSLTSLRTLDLSSNNFDDMGDISLNGTYTDLQYVNLLDNPLKNFTTGSVTFLPFDTVVALK